MNQIKNLLQKSSIRLSLLVLTGIFLFCQSYSQIAIGQWREHLPYSFTSSVTEGDQNRIYCATPYSLFYIDRSENSIHRLNTVNGLSDVNISCINYDESSGNLLIAYLNANIDLIQNDKITNLSDIKRKPIVGSKKINSIHFREKKAYLCCAFGIVVVDLVKKEIKETWYPGHNGQALNVNDFAYDSINYYLATDKGVLYAPISSTNLANFQSWKLIHDLPVVEDTYNSITIYKNQLMLNKSNTNFGKDSIFIKRNGQWELFNNTLTGPNHKIRAYGDTLAVTIEYGFRYFYNDLNSEFNEYTYNLGPNSPMPYLSDASRAKDGTFWLADKELGLVHSYAPWSFNFYLPNGPAHTNPIAMSIAGSSLWVASGGLKTDWDNIWLSFGLYAFKNESWNSFNKKNTPALDTIPDIISIAVDPSNAEHVFAGSWGKGLLEFKNNQLINIYNKTNSPLLDAVNYPGFIGIGGLHFDEDNNLWITNSANPKGLLMLKPDGTWFSFNLSPTINSDVISSVITDDLGQKWIILPRGNSVMVFNDNTTYDNQSDDRKFKLSTAVGAGKLPSNAVLSFAKDKNGYIWLGTTKGVAVIYSPENVFTGKNFDAQQIYVPQEGITQYLLASEEVTAIAVDGSNKKWFGTQNAGVFLMSEDCSEQIYHFTRENSPLLSNTIYSIAIDGQSGEVFFGTENGIISYRSMATEGGDKNENVKVFPNPVRENYNGYIAISGLVENANYTITDIAGNLVHKGIAEGGQAVWNGKNYSGERVSSGVYLVFATNEDGEETAVAKIMFIH